MLAEVIWKVSMEDEESIQLFLSQEKKLKRLDLLNLGFFKYETSNWKYLNYETLKSLNLIFINPDISSAVITKLLEAAPNLEDLHLIVFSEKSELLPVLQNFTHLRSLGCGLRKLDNRVFQAIIARNPFLTDVKIMRDNEVLSTKVDFNPDIWHQITSLTLFKSVPLEMLFAVMNAAPLRSLVLNADFVESSSGIESVETMALETIVLNGKMSATEFGKILSKSTALKVLELWHNGIESFSQDFSLNLRQLKIANCQLSALGLKQLTQESPRLVEIELNNVKASLENSIWLASCPQLNTFKLKGAGFWGRALRPCALPALTTLSIEITSEHPIDTASLQNLLQASPKLQFLTFKNIKKSLDLGSEALPLTLAELQSFELLSCHLDQNLLSSILQASTSLRQLRLIESNLSPSIEKYEFSCLRQLMIAGMKISSEQWVKILAQAPALQELTITFTEFKHVSLEAGCLSSLKRLKISRIAEHDLWTLLEAAPHLEALEITQSMPPISARLRERLRSVHFTPPSVQLGSTATLPLADPTHAVETFKDISPEPKDKTAEELETLDKTLNQGMVIHKLECFAELVSRHSDIIPKIKSGICYALSRLYQQEPDKFTSILTTLRSWNGRESGLTPAILASIERVFTSIYFYQFGQSPTYFLGENLTKYVATMEASLVIENPWHAIVVEKLGVNAFRIYDPNFVGGPKIVDEKAVLKKIHDCLGDLISINVPCPSVQISNPEQFLAHGGLLTLMQSVNYLEIIPHLPITTWTDVALDGLFLRDNAGIPAWVLGLTSDQALKVDLSRQMMRVYLSLNFKRGIAQLSKSLEHVKGLKLQTLREKLVVMFPDLLEEGLRVPDKSMMSIQVSMFRSWQGKTLAYEHGVVGYVQACLGMEPPRQRLIECQGENMLQGLRYALSYHARMVSRPVFMVNSADDLVCQTPSVQLGADGFGHIGFGSPLSRFLHEHPNGILIIDYQSFAPDDIVRFNTMLDKSRKVDGLDIPDSIQIIGLNDSKNPKAYRESDFYSRFTVVESCPFGDEDLHSYIPELGTTSTGGEPYPLSLYQAQDFESLLLGRWILNGETLSFQEGQLIRALKAGKQDFVLYNAPSDDPKFRRFWQDILQQGYLEHLGQVYPLPALHLQFSNGYSWDKYQSRVSVITALPTDYQLLNPSLFSLFFQDYKIEGERLHALSGLIEQASDSKLVVFVTRDIDADAWAQIFDECERYSVNLELALAPGVSLPDPLKHLAKTAVKSESFGAQVILVQDPDVIIPSMSADAMVVDITECDVSDIFMKIEFHDGFCFSKRSSAILEALKADKKVILTGKISPEMADHLSTLILKSEYEDNLLIIVEMTSPFDYVQCYGIHNEMEYKQQLLDVLGGWDESIALSLPYAQLLTIKTLGEAAYKGLESAHAPIAQPKPLDPSTSAEETKAFVEMRMHAVSEVLSIAPFVFLSGLSGVGKTQFVRHELSSIGTLYEGQSQILAWIEDKIERTKFLFIDEANLSDTEWSLFEGLYQHPPTIYLDGCIHHLTVQHRVVFAGNPLSYGDERHLPSLVARHGNSVWFDLLPTAFIYEKILQPMFVDTPLAEFTQEISEEILKAYQFLCAYSQTEVLISPRELQMMAALILSCCREPTQLPAVKEHVIYLVAKALVPIEGKLRFEQIFKPKQPWPYVDYPQMPDWVMTASRQPYYQQLHDLLGLRAWRKAEGRHPEQQFGGLGGMIIEGMPGVGKSEMVMAALRALDYHELAPGTSSERPNIFYRMPVSWSLEEKQTLLLAAFDQGAVVVIDEINSSPMMEQLLNALLMGHDLNGRPPTRPGFMVIGTQNPSFMAGRETASTALSRRMLQVRLPSYTVDELIHILTRLDVRRQDARALAEAFFQASEEARVHHYTPAPTLRDLIQKARPFQKSLIQQLEERITALKHSRDSFFSSTDLEGRIAGLQSIVADLAMKADIRSKVELFIYNYPEESPQLLAQLQAQYAAPYCGAGSMVRPK